MTEHVRTTYRRHRWETWVLATILVLTMAAIAIPIASGTEGKTYELTVAPAATCASPATARVTVKNTASPQALGSIEIYFPPNTVASAQPGSVRTNQTSSAQPLRRDIVALDNFNVAAGASKSVTVTFNAGVTFNTAITAVAKQSNRFNDSSGSANTFSISGGFPTLKIVTCVTVSGRVYQDRNLDNVYTTGAGAFLNADVPKAWTVKLYAKNVGASSYVVVQTKTSDGIPPNPSDPLDPGRFWFTQVPTQSDYKICVTATTPPDSNSMWSIQPPPASLGNIECGPITTTTPGGPNTSANQLPDLRANALTQDFLVVPVVGPVGRSTPSTTVGGYTVDPSSNSTKANDFYVQDTWVDSQGRTNFRFSPITACPPSCPAGDIYLLETLESDVTLASLGGKQVQLRYDDAPPFLDVDLKPMPYCLKDPRTGQPTGSLATSGVLGTNVDSTPATSCIVEASQLVVAGAKVETVYTVYTSYDGGRQIG